MSTIKAKNIGAMTCVKYKTMYFLMIYNVYIIFAGVGPL